MTSGYRTEWLDCLLGELSVPAKRVFRQQGGAQPTFTGAAVRVLARAILSGTPAPHSLLDLWSQFTFLWPSQSVLGSRAEFESRATNGKRSVATIKKELIHGRSWPTKAEPRTEVFEYIEIFFNRRRRHSTLGMLSPTQFERNHHQQTEKIDSAATVAA